MNDGRHLNIELIPGKIAPRYDHTVTELSIDKAVITEQGMQTNKPIVDFQMTDNKGNKYFAILTRDIAKMLSSAIDGVNLRNHGTVDP